MEQKVCRDGDNEMSDNGASTLLQLKINPIEIWCFSYLSVDKNVCWHGGGCIIVKKNSGWDKLTWG